MDLRNPVEAKERKVGDLVLEPHDPRGESCTGSARPVHAVVIREETTASDGACDVTGMVPRSVTSRRIRND